MQQLKNSVGSISFIYLLITLQISLFFLISIKRNYQQIEQFIQKYRQQIKQEGFFILEFTVWSLLFGGLLYFTASIYARQHQLIDYHSEQLLQQHSQQCARRSHEQ